jgi:hypothetical protein
MSRENLKGASETTRRKNFIVVLFEKNSIYRTVFRLAIFLDESTDRAVVCFFHLWSEIASGKLIGSFMIGNALTTNTFAGARFICTIALCQVGALLTIHDSSA